MGELSAAHEIARRLDTIYDTELTNHLVVSLSSPSYTLAQLSALARDYINDVRNHWAEGHVVEVELRLSLFLAYLQRLENRP